MNKSIVWTIAGSDSSGGAGVQIDLQTFQSLGVHGCSVITAMTAQNNMTITDVYCLPLKQITSQILALENGLFPSAIKIGMLGNLAIIDEVKCFLERFPGKIILDPLIISTSGKNLFEAEMDHYLASLQKIFPLVDLITPNLFEAEMILGRVIKSYQDMEKAAQDILLLGAKSVLMKGGHFDETLLSQDYWTNKKESFWLSSKRYQGKNYRGTGCMLSSAITACLALHYKMKEAVVIGKMYLTQNIRLAQKFEQATTSLSPATWPENRVDFPYVSATPIVESIPIFPTCGKLPLGLYPIVDSVKWLQQLLPLGVSTIQLRIKNKKGGELETEIRQGIEFAKKYQTRLFINDYWQLAIRFGAYGVHLGQEDLTYANVEAIQKAGLRLGISTHSYFEVARAHAFKPSYIAYGPIFATTSKKMSVPPQGILKLQRWRRTLDYPLVAIGGINLDNLKDVLATNVDGIAMISAISQNPNPVALTQQLLKITDRYQLCRTNSLHFHPMN